jgi:hypothetical protein
VDGLLERQHPAVADGGAEHAGRHGERMVRPW